MMDWIMSALLGMNIGLTLFFAIWYPGKWYAYSSGFGAVWCMLYFAGVFDRWL